MTTQALHHPLNGTTPSQRLAAAEHLRRMERIRVAALPQPKPAPEPEILPPIPNELFAEVAKLEFPRIILGQVETILRAVLVHFPGIGMNDIKSARRTDNIVRPRQIAMYLIKEYTTRTLPDIGRRIGGRDHTTVLYAVRKIRAEIETNPALAEQIEKIRVTIKEMSA